MAHRLQVLIDEAELKEIRRIARREHVTVAEWVRRALTEARRRVSGTSPGTKRDALAKATAHAFPTADIDDMLAEIERGYAEGG